MTQRRRAVAAPMRYFRSALPKMPVDEDASRRRTARLVPGSVAHVIADRLKNEADKASQIGNA